MGCDLFSHHVDYLEERNSRTFSDKNRCINDLGDRVRYLASL